MHLLDIDDCECAPEKIAQISAVLAVHKQDKPKGKIQYCMSATLESPAVHASAGRSHGVTWCHCCKGEGTYITMKHWSSMLYSTGMASA